MGEQWVLTAAHIFDSQLVDDVAYTYAKAEVHQYYGNVQYKAQVAKFIPHDTYDVDHELNGDFARYGQMADICLLRLRAPLEGALNNGTKVTAAVRPATLPDPLHVIRDFTELRYAGYGKNDRKKRNLGAIDFKDKYPWGNIEGELLPWAEGYQGRLPLLEGETTKLPWYYCGLFRDFYDDFGKKFYTDKMAKAFHEYFDNLDRGEQDDLNRFYVDPWNACVGNTDLGARANADHGDSGMGVFMGPFNGPNANTVYGVFVALSVPPVQDAPQFTQTSMFVPVAPLVQWITNTMDNPWILFF